VTAEYLPPENVNACRLIKMITDQHAALLAWNSHIYVLDGVTYVWIASGNATLALRRRLQFASSFCSILVMRTRNAGQSSIATLTI
jgi:hypothetical protein